MKAIQVTWDELCNGEFDKFGKLEHFGDPRCYYTPALGIPALHAAPEDPDHPGLTLVIVGGWFVTIGGQQGLTYFVTEEDFRRYYEPVTGSHFNCNGDYRLRDVKPKEFKRLYRQQLRFARPQTMAPSALKAYNRAHSWYALCQRRNARYA